MTELVEHWQSRYDWRRCEEQLNSLGQFRTAIDGLGIQFLHARSPEPDALPLIITHGWPGSVVEMMQVIAPLTDPVRHGGSAADAFHVVVPSLPGYGFSEKPKSAGWNVPRIAAAWATLMGRLGYDRYVAQGGDWGSMVTATMGAAGGEHLAGIHLNMVVVRPDRQLELTAHEQAMFEDLATYQRVGSGYMNQQSTRPQTLGYGLVDSPVGQAAWIAEKFWEWTDHGGDLNSILSFDQILDNVMHYWLPGTGASSARLYWETAQARSFAVPTVPLGISVFPKEIFRATERLAARMFPSLTYFNEVEAGGHFAAFEQPALFVEEVRACFRSLR